MQLTSRLNRACVCACLGAHTCRRHEQRSQTSRAHDTEERAAEREMLKPPFSRDGCRLGGRAPLFKYVRSDRLRSAYRLGRGQSPLSSHSCARGARDGGYEPACNGADDVAPPPCVLCSYDSLVPLTKTRPRGSLTILVNLASRWTRQRREGCAGSCCRSGRAAVRDHAPIRLPASGRRWHCLPPNSPGKNNAAAPAATRLRLRLALSEHAVIDTAQMRLLVAFFFFFFIPLRAIARGREKDGTAQVLLPGETSTHSLLFFPLELLFWHVLFGVSCFTGAHLQNRHWNKLSEKRWGRTLQQAAWGET